MINGGADGIFLLGDWLKSFNPAPVNPRAIPAFLGPIPLPPPPPAPPPSPPPPLKAVSLTMKGDPFLGVANKGEDDPLPPPPPPPLEDDMEEILARPKCLASMTAPLDVGLFGVHSC